MASDNEASCVSDPNFAVICSFLEKFGSSCGIQSPDFLELQEMLENTQEVSPELIDLHIKLLRKARRSVSGDRWERALIKLCHSYCSQDAWELERFGYKKARLSSKLQILKKLLEMQFDANPKFKAEINRLTAAELRTEPIGRDSYGHAYWYQVDEHCQVRVYREDLDEETWILVAKDREGLMRLISQLSSNDPNIGDLVLNEDSNSLSIEKPITDTGQTSSTASNCEVDESSAGNEIDESSAGNEVEVDESSVGNEVDSAGNDVDESSVEIEESQETVADPAEQKLIETKPVSIVEEVVAKSESSNNEIKLALDVARKTEIFSEMKEENVTEANSSEIMGIDLSMSQSSSVISSSKSVVPLPNKRKKSINELAVNLRIKTHEQLCKPAVQEQEIDLSIKKNKLDVQPISSLSVPPYEPSFMETALRIPLEYRDSDEELEDEEDEFYESDEIELPSHIKRPRLDRPTLLGNVRKQPDSELDDEYGDEIEEEVMYVRGEGSGRDCNNENTLHKSAEDNNSGSTELEVSEAIEESVMFVYGDGSGHECGAGNNSTDEETSADNKTEQDCKRSSAGTSSVPLSGDVCAANLQCDNVNRTDDTECSLASEAATVSVSNKSSVNREDSCSVTDTDQIDASTTDVHSVASAIKSDNNSDNTNLAEVQSKSTDTNISEHSIRPRCDEQTVKLAKIGKIIVDVKSLDKTTQDVNHSPVKKSRWDVGKPCKAVTDAPPASSSVERRKTVEGSVNILEVSASINCSINDKLVDAEIVNASPNATDVANALETPQDEINCLPKGTVQEMVSKWEHAFDGNKPNVLEDVLATNIKDVVDDIDKSVPQKQQFFFGPGCFQFKSLISKSPERNNIENTSTSAISGDIKQECDVNENKNEETCSLNIRSDDALKHNVDSMITNVKQHVNVKQSVDSTSLNDSKTSVCETIENTLALSQTETIADKEKTCTITKDSRQESTVDNKSDTELELKSNLTAISVDSESTGVTCSDVNETENIREASTVSLQTCTDNSTENMLNTKEISQISIDESDHVEKNTESIEISVTCERSETDEIKTENDVKSDEVDTPETIVIATESETSQFDSEHIQSNLEPVVLAESKNSDDANVDSTSVQDNHSEKIESIEVDSSTGIDTNSVVEGGNATQENIQASTSSADGNNSSEKIADIEEQFVSETDEIFRENVQEKKSHETDNKSDETVLDNSELSVQILTENVQPDIGEEKHKSRVEEVDETDSESEQSSKSDEINSTEEITADEKCTRPDDSHMAQTLVETVQSNESDSRSLIVSVDENSDTSQESTKNKQPNECDIEDTYAEFDAETHTVSDISNDTSSLQVETSSLDKDQCSSNESMDVTNSSVQDDDNELQIVTDNSESSIVLSETTQLQIFANSEIVDKHEESLVDNCEVQPEDNKHYEKGSTAVETRTDMSEELTEVDRTSSPDIHIAAAKIITSEPGVNSSTQESINNQSETSHAASVVTEDSIDSEKHNVASSLEQAESDHKRATDKTNSANTSSDRESIETIVNTTDSNTLALNENVPSEVSNIIEKENVPAFQGTTESCNIKSVSVSEEKEIISNVVDTAVGESIPETCTQNMSTDANVELTKITVTNFQTLTESTEQTTSVSTALDKNETPTDAVVQSVNYENIPIQECVESATDLSVLKADSLKSEKDVQISASNVTCFSENIKAQSFLENTEAFQMSTEVLSSGTKQISQNPINTNLQNTHFNEEHLETNLCTNLNRDKEFETDSNVVEMKNREELGKGKRKESANITERLENLNEINSMVNESTVIVTKDICELTSKDTIIQSDNNLQLDAMKTNVLVQQTDHIETEKSESSKTLNELITKTKQTTDIRINPLEISKDKQMSDIHFDESENDEFSSDEDRFESCIMEPNEDCEIDGDADEELSLEVKVPLPKINEQFGEAMRDTKKHLECDKHTTVSGLDEKKVIVPEDNKSDIIMPIVNQTSDSVKIDFKTVVDSEKLFEKDICKLEDTSTENQSSIEKDSPFVDLKTDADKPTVDDNDCKPTLICVDISKLQDASDIIKPVNKSVTELKMQSDISSPRSVESVGVDNEESSDIVDVPETDPLACTEEDLLDEKTEQVNPPAPSAGLSLATFKLDGTDTDNSLIPEPIARALRNRKISMEAAAAKETRKRARPSVEDEEAEADNSVDSKRRRMRGKRSVDVNLRRSVESKHADVSSSEEDPLEKSTVEDGSPALETAQRNTTPRRGTGKARRGKRGRGRGSFASRTAASTPVQDSGDLQSETPRSENTSTSPPVSTKTPTSGRKKRRMLGLDIDPNVLVEQNKQVDDTETTSRGTVVRQSRRIAQLKIKEEAERRKIEELTLTEIKEGYKKKKSKRDDDKDYKEDKKKRKQKLVTDDEEESDDEVAEISEKKARKKRRKHQDPRKLFNSTNPWQSSSGSSTSNDEEEDEEVEEEPSDEEAVLKSDHEFSPESDLESNAEVQPLRRARTVKKESDTEDPTDEHACQKCGKADHPEWILLCDKCDCGWHCSCLRPALLVIPEGDWFCPPCQHITLVEALKVQLLEYDKKVSRRDMEVRRQERLAYVGISLNNVLPAKEQDGNRVADANEQDAGSDEESSNSESSSGSSSGDDSEPIYQLRERRQAHSYRFNDYDELINSAIQDEIEAVKGAGNQGRGKDIATIVNAEKEEANTQTLLEQQQQQEQQPLQAPAHDEPFPPIVPVHAEKQASEHDEASEKDSEEELRVVPKMAGRKKHRKLNSLDISSEDDPDDDEDFKGTSEEEEEDLDDLGSEDSDDYDVGRRGKRRSGPIRRSTRARTTRYDREFINDDSDDDEPRRKKTRSIWDESESEESDTSWGKRKKSKKQRPSTSPRIIKKTRKKKKRREDSDPDVRSRAKPKKAKIKFGGLNDSGDDDDDEMLTRRTRGKKINYIDALGSDSDEDKPAAKRIESEDEYVANEDDEEEDVADTVGGKESDSDSALERPPIVPKKLLNFKPGRGGRGRGKGGIARTHKPTVTTPVSAALSVSPMMADEDADDDDSPPIDIPVIAANPDDLNEEEVGTMMMENEEYAKKQLELMAIQLAKEKKKKEREAKQRALLETAIEPPQPIAEPKKRGRKKKVVEPVLQPPDQAALIMNSSLPFGQNQIPPNTHLPSMHQGISPLLMQAASPSKLDGIPPMEISSTVVPTVVSDLTPSPPKRRGRGKGKKTLAAEAAAAGAPLPLTPTSTSTGSIVPVMASAAPVTTTPAPAGSLIGVPPSADVVHTAMSTIEPPTNLSIDASIHHGGKLGIASPPQPFSQSQPSPSVITRMLQSQPVSSAQPFTTVASSMNQKYFGGMCEQRGPPPGQFSAIGGARGRVPSPYRQPPPAGMALYPGMRPVAPNSPHRLRSPGPPALQQMFHSTHHPLDPSPSGGGPISIASVNRDRNSPAPAVSSPLTSKDGPTPPPQYIRGPMVPGQRFTPADTSPGPSLAPPVVRHHMSFGPTRPPHAGNFSPYHPPPPPNYHYGAYPPAPTLAAADDALPPTDYQASPYPEPHYGTGEPIVHSSDGSNSKPFDEEGSGEFGGLVSYFSSQREDDLDT